MFGRVHQEPVAHFVLTLTPLTTDTLGINSSWSHRLHIIQASTYCQTLLIPSRASMSLIYCSATLCTTVSKMILGAHAHLSLISTNLYIRKWYERSITGWSRFIINASSFLSEPTWSSQKRKRILHHQSGIFVLASFWLTVNSLHGLFNWRRPPLSPALHGERTGRARSHHDAILMPS